MVNIQKTAPRYRLLGTDGGFMVEYRMPETGEKIYIPIGSASEYRALIGRLNNPEFVNKLYRAYKSQALMAKNKKRPSPAQRKAGAKRNAAVLKKYLSVQGENIVRGWDKYAVSKKQIPLRTNKKDYAVGMGFGPLEEGGNQFYTSLVIPVPTEGGVKPQWGEINVMDYLNIAAGFGAKEYKSATGKLSRHSKLWAKLLKHVKVGKKSKASIKSVRAGKGNIINGNLAKSLYEKEAA